MRRLSLARTGVSDISVLAHLLQLEWLNLARTGVSDISVLAHLTQLTSLSLNYTDVSDISVLVNLPNLEGMDLRGCPLSRASYTHILALQVKGIEVVFDQADIHISIRDAELAAAIREALGLGEGAPITAVAMRELTALDASNQRFDGLADLTGLEHATSLVVLDLRGTGVSDISVLSNLTQLTRLSLNYTDVSDISVLANLTQLEWLGLNYTDVSDISVLANLTQLTSLSLNYTRVSDISALANLTKLRSLDLRGTGVSDISALANLTNLTHLLLGGTGVSDISALANLTQLEWLILSNTDVSDISVLVNLPNLVTLDLDGCPLSRASHTHVLALRARGVTVDAPDPPPPVEPPVEPPSPPSPPPPPTWTLDDRYSGPNDDRGNGNEIHDIEFRDNHQVFYGKHDRLYKWDFNANRAWWTDHHGDRVSHVEVPRGDSSVVIYTVDDRGRIDIKGTDNFNTLVSYRVPFDDDTSFLSLDVDRGGYFIVLQYLNIRHFKDRVEGGFLAIGGKPPVSARRRYEAKVYDTWDGGWTVQYVTGDHWNSPDGDLIMHPDSDSSTPRFYRQSSPEHASFDEVTGSYNNNTDSYFAPHAGHLDRLAITNQYGSGNYTRLAALANDNDIHVWNYSGDLLFTLNESEDYSAHDDILEFTPNGELLVTAYGRWVRFWDVGAQALDHSFRADAMDDNESIESLAFSDNGKLMALGSSDGTAYIYRWTGESAPTAPAKEAETQPTALLANYPNPFNPETWIPYQLSDPAEVTVSIYSVDGKLVRTLELGQMPAGAYSDKERAAYWDGQNEQGEPVASGVYFYTLTAGDFSATRKMVIRK